MQIYFSPDTDTPSLDFGEHTQTHSKFTRWKYLCVLFCSSDAFASQAELENVMECNVFAFSAHSQIAQVLLNDIN